MTVELRNRLIPLAIASAMLIGSSIAESRVVRITIDSRTPLSNGAFFGTVGPYELVRGTASGELDPNDRRNAVITDITLAPKNAAGKVEYRSQFTIYKPVDLNRASGTMISYVPNRGRIEIPYVTDDPDFLWSALTCQSPRCQTDHLSFRQCSIDSSPCRCREASRRRRSL